MLFVWAALLLLSRWQTGECNCNNENMEVIGAGSSFPAPLYQHLLGSYAAERFTRGFNVDGVYNAVNSGYGKAKIVEAAETPNRFIFAGTESLLDSSVALQHPELKTFPVLAGGLVVTYNLPGISELILSITVLPLIFDGNVTHWSDDRIQVDNPNITLPHQAIRVIVRKDSAGDTQILTSALSEFDENWKNGRGVIGSPEFVDGKSTRWNNSAIYLFANRAPGMVGVVLSVPYSIGYVAYANAYGLGTKYAKLKNAYGTATYPEETSIQAAMDALLEEAAEGTLTFSLNNAPNENAYPIASFSFMIVNTTGQPNITRCEMIELIGFVEYVLTGEAFKDYGLVVLSDSFREQIQQDILQQLTYNDEKLYEAYLLSIVDESVPAWEYIVYVLVPFTCVVALLGLTLYCVNKRNKSQTRDLWMLKSVKLRVKEAGDSAMSSEMLGSTPKSYYGDDVVYVDDELTIREIPHRWSTKAQHFCSRARQFRNRNVLPFLGVTFVSSAQQEAVGASGNCVVYEYPGKGTLHQVLKGTRYNLNDDIKFNMALDIAMGLSALHRENIVLSNLSSLTCFVDQTWTTKIGSWTNYSLYHFQQKEAIEKSMNVDITTLQNPERVIQLIYVDPRQVSGEVDRASDLFSLGLLFIEIFTRQIPYSVEMENNVLNFLGNKIGKRTAKPPDFSSPGYESIPQTIRHVVKQCLNESTSNRPEMKVVISQLRMAQPTKRSIVDVMMATMEEYMAELEVKVKHATSELEVASKKLEDLLYEVLPRSVAMQLMAGEKVDPVQYDSVSIAFFDVCDFGAMAAGSSPMNIMDFLNDIWNMMDTLLEAFDVYKADVINENYMVASGLPQRNGQRHIRECCLLALAVIEKVSKMQVRHRPGLRVRVRAGVNTGSVTTGVVGNKMPQYCIFGDTVNTASRMQSTSEPNRIQLSLGAKELLLAKYTDQFSVSLRGEIEVKGKGMMKTYWLEKSAASSNLVKEYLQKSE